MWSQIKILTTSNNVEPICNFLNLLGALSITFQDAADQPILEPDLHGQPLWEELFVIALFPEKSDITAIINFLKINLPENAISDYQTQIVEDKIWKNAWLEYYKPMQFGSKLWVGPTGFKAPSADSITVWLDPGLAFGTGTHPTTALCLEWLAEHPPIDKIVLDYGCGSGILSLAALKLGARSVIAVDHDDQALEATLENAKRNALDLSRLQICLPDQFAETKVDLIVANILAKTLIGLAPLFARVLNTGGKVVLSGILTEQAESVMQAYQPFFNNFSILKKEDWVLIVT